MRGAVVSRLMLFVFSMGVLTGSAQAMAAEAESLVNRLPLGALATVEVAKLGPVIERIENSPELKKYLDSPLYDEALKNDGVRQALAGKAIAEAQLVMSLWQAGKTYFGDRIVLGVYQP